MSFTEFAAWYLTGLFVSYGAGLVVGIVVKYVKNLGNVA